MLLACRYLLGFNCGRWAGSPHPSVPCPKRLLRPRLGPPTAILCSQGHNFQASRPTTSLPKGQRLRQVHNRTHRTDCQHQTCTLSVSLGVGQIGASFEDVGTLLSNRWRASMTSARVARGGTRPPFGRTSSDRQRRPAPAVHLPSLGCQALRRSPARDATPPSPPPSSHPRPNSRISMAATPSTRYRCSARRFYPAHRADTTPWTAEMSSPGPQRGPRLRRHASEQPGCFRGLGRHTL